MHSWHSVSAFAKYLQFARDLQSCLHEVVVQQPLALTVLQSSTDHIRFQIGFHLSSGQTQSLNRFYLLVFRCWLPHREISVGKSNVGFLLLTLSWLGSPLLLRIRLLWWVLVSLLLVSLLFLLGAGLRPSHHIRKTNKSFVLGERMYFEGGNDKLSFLQIGSGEVVDNDIGIEDNFLEKSNFLGLYKGSLTSITLRTPPGTYNLLSLRVVPTIRLGLSGWRWSLRSRAMR